MSQSCGSRFSTSTGIIKDYEETNLCMVVLVLVLNFRARKLVSVQEICENLFGEVAVLADNFQSLLRYSTFWIGAGERNHGLHTCNWMDKRWEGSKNEGTIWKLMEQRVREIDTMKGTSHSHGDHKRSHIPSGDANTATFKPPAKNPECGIANTPYLKVVEISSSCPHCFLSWRSLPAGSWRKYCRTEWIRTVLILVRFPNRT